MPQSEISQLRKTIHLEHEAALQGLSGIASGVSRHAFIEARMNQHLERFVQLLKDGKIDQVDTEITFPQTELWELQRGVTS